MLFLPFLGRVRERWIRIFMALDDRPARLPRRRRLPRGQRDRGREHAARSAASSCCSSARRSRTSALVALDRYLDGRRGARRAGRSGRLPARAAGRDRDRAAQPRRGPRDRLRLRDRRARARRVPRLRLRAAQHDRGPRDRRPARRGGERPVARAARRCSGLIAGAPAIVGAFIGASVSNAELVDAPDRRRHRRDRPGDRPARADDPRRRPAARCTRRASAASWPASPCST